MIRQLFKCNCLIALLVIYALNITAQVSYSDAGYLSVIDFGATPDFPGDDDRSAINECIQAAMNLDKGVFLPAGDYHITGSLIVQNDELGCDQFIMIAGSSKYPNHRSRVILKQGSGSHTVFESIEFGLAGGTCHGNSGWTDTYHRVLKHVDVVVESDNPNAVGVRWRGAEGCGVYDVHVDLTAEPTAIGFQNLPGSGGSVHTISVLGGKIAIDLYPYGDFWEGTQPSPTVSGGYFGGQTDHAVAGQWRGMLNLVGCHFKMSDNAIVVKDIRRMGQGGYGGSAALIDCIVEYESAEGNNTAMTMMEYQVASGFTFTNSYFKHLDFITTGHVGGNPDGWVYYEEVAYDDETNFVQGGIEVKQGVFIDKELEVEENIWIKSTVTSSVPPSDLCTRHRLPLPFPSFETDGAVSITDFEGDVADGDWSPAFNNAIAQSDVVVLPNGEYMITNTIHLNSNTKLLGLHHERTTIYSPGTRSFDTSDDPYAEPKPLVDTPDDADATCMISDLAINAGIPLAGSVQNPGAVGGYPLLWRAGRNSVIKHIDVRHYQLNYFRDHYAIANADYFEEINLKQTPSPVNLGELVVKTYNTTGVWNTDAVFSSAFLLETHDDDQRLITRPFDDVFDYQEYSLPYSTPNLTIASTSGSTFDLATLSLGTADFNTRADTIRVMGYKNGSSLAFDTIELVTNEANPRPMLQPVEAYWTALDSVVVTAGRAFALGSLSTSYGTFGFENISGSALDYDARITQVMYQHLHTNPEVHDKVLITGNGGGKWYNHQLHGKQWLNFNSGFLRIKDTYGNEPLHIYHLHAQHGHQRARVYIENASQVSIYGTKVEIPTSFIRVKDADNIRVFGHGGLTNPIPGHNYYYFENTTNYLVAGLGEQTYDYNLYPGDEFNELTRVAIQEGAYRTLMDVTNGVPTDPGFDYKPILWRVGNPGTGTPQGCSEFRSLNVENGQGSWQYCVGEEVTVFPDQPDCMEFTGWTGYLVSEEDTLTFVMPNEDITLTAEFEESPTYDVTVNNGFGSGFYCEGSQVYVYANEPEPGFQFKQWAGDLDRLSDSTVINPVLTVANSAVTITAEYEEAEIVPEVEIINPVNGDLFQHNEEISIQANTSISEGAVSKVGFYNGETLLAEVSAEPFSYSWSYQPEEVEELKLVAKAYSDAGTAAISDTVFVTVNPVRSPYFGTPHVIPGRIEAEHYDWGGFNNAYRDDDIINRWDDFRVDEGVDIQVTLDDEGDYNIGYIENQEYLKYTVFVEEEGYYSLTFRIGSAVGGGQLRVDSDGNDVTGVINFPNTGSWQNWADTEIQQVGLNAGEQTLTFRVVNRGFNLNYIDFQLDSIATAVEVTETAEKYKVYPSLVQNDLYIETEQLTEGTNIFLFNNYGQMVLEERLTSGLQRIDVSYLAPGIFYLVIKSPRSDPSAHKLIKMNR